MTSSSNPEEGRPSPKVDANAANSSPQNGPQTQPNKDVVTMSRTRLIFDSLFLIAGMVTYVADLATDISVGKSNLLTPFLFHILIYVGCKCFGDQVDSQDLFITFRYRKRCS